VKNRGKAGKPIMRPQIEALEGRALLSSLSDNLTTSQPVYQPGQPIQFVFTMTNTGSQPVQTAYGPSDDGFDITQDGTLVYQSNAGINPMFIRLDTLQPGQSVTLEGSWNGISNQGARSAVAAGTFTVTNQLDPNGASATFQIGDPSPLKPVTPVAPVPPDTPVAPVAPMSATIAASRRAIQIGHPASFTLTLTNSGSQPIDFAHLSGSESFTLSQGTNVIWRSTGTALRTQVVQALAPGQSIEIHGRWSGRPNRREIAAIKPGLYQLAAMAEGYTASATIRLTR
jgi:Intracellular proteinase inhibitor